MSKISSIEISDFRVYESKQSFSFYNGKEIANLVVIYAPNGFGKTSFFDAVEWGFSGKINRFERDQIRDEIAKREFSNGDQILLTNRKSHLKGKEGEIKIITQEGRTLCRSVGSRKVNNQKVKYDYRHGSLTGDFTDKELAKLTSTNILTQDQIDSFLRYTSPEDKFTALSEFWPEGVVATRTYKNLNGYLRVIENDIRTTSVRISELGKLIKSLLNTDKNINAINTSIQQLTAGSIIEFKIDQIAHPVDDAVYQSLSDATLTFIKKADRFVEISANQKTKLLELQEKFPAFIKAQKQIDKDRKDQKSVEQLEKLYVDLRSATRIQAERAQGLAKLIANLSDLKKLNDLIDVYLVSSTTIADQEKLNTLLLLENQLSLAKISIYQNSQNKLQEHQSDLSLQLDNLNKSISILDDQYTQFIYWKAQLNKDNETLKTVDSSLQTKEEQIELQMTRRRFITLLLEGKNYLALKEPDVIGLGQVLDDYIFYHKAIADAEVQLKAKQLEYQQSGSLDENLDKMLSWGEEYVKTLDADHCPLCKTEFVNANELLARIKSEKATVLKVAAQQEALASLSETKSLLNSSYSLAVTAIENYLNAELEICLAIIKGLQKEKDELANARLDLSNSVRHSGDQAQQFHNDLKNHFLSEIAIEAQQPEEVKARLQKEAANVSAKMEKLSRLLVIKKELLDSVENSLIVNRNRITGLENSALLVRSDKRYLDSLSLLQTLYLPDNEINKTAISDRINELEAQVEKEQLIINEQRQKADGISVAINKHALKLLEEEISGYKLELENRIKSLDEIITAFREQYYFQIIAKKIELSNIAEALVSISRHQNEMEMEAGRLRDFAIQIELINDNITKAKLETELGELKAKIPRLESAKEKLLAAKKAAANYIDREINNYFNKDVINQIYSRIEPHPDLNTIDFIPEITDRGPSLNVKAVGSVDNLNPVLYLSAGQLNVLSLSIFLAKAFETGSEVISTIFMDDPVQNLSDINILSFIDLIRSMVTTFDKQLVISSHDEHFYKLIQHKMPASDFNAAYIELGNFGQIKATVE